MSKKISTRNKLLVTFVVVALAFLAISGTNFLGTEADNPKVIANGLTAKVAPQKGTSQTLVAPSTKKWWRFVTGLGNSNPTLRDLDLPDEASWIGLTSGRSAKPKAEHPSLTVFYIGFESRADAKRFASSSSKGRLEVACGTMKDRTKVSDKRW